MDIPINVDVYCQGKTCGHTTSVVINPVTDVITSVVVKEKEAPHTERLVPLKLVEKSSPEGIYLNCDVAGLSKLESFTNVSYIPTSVPRYMGDYGLSYAEPFVVRVKVNIPVTHEGIPMDELSIHRGANVYSSDEHHVGQVDEFLVDQSDGHVTHLIMRKGHLWGEKEISIPVAEISQIKETSVYLKLDKDEIGELPTIAVHRRWA